MRAECESALRDSRPYDPSCRRGDFALSRYLRGTDIACMLGKRGTGKDPGLLARPAASAAGIPGREVTTVTITDIGILLIVLCIFLWAIMAALHRHTVQLEALKSQMQELLKAREMGGSASSTEAGPSAPYDRMASSAHAPAKSASAMTARQSVLK